MDMKQQTGFNRVPGPMYERRLVVRSHLIISVIVGIFMILTMSSCSNLDMIDPDAPEIDETTAVINTLSVLIKMTCDAESACIMYSSDPIEFGDGSAYYEDGWWKYEEEDGNGRTFLAVQYHDWDNRVQDFPDSETLWIHFRMEFRNDISGIYYKMRFFRHSQLGFFYPLWKLKGDGTFSASVYEGTLEVEESNMNSLKLPRCPNTGWYTLVFSPYLANVNMNDVQYATVRLNTGTDEFIFQVDKRTGEIIR
jgi:hypothetical protein